ncbi:hypothetical protein [Sphingomonas adhaesiva]|uniref:hypothetical protein n=1 Tax=Sphingomonas adhaesiva TaxID=28212 RepID=UPI002FFB3595
MHLRGGAFSTLERAVYDQRDGRPIGLTFVDTSYKRVRSNGGRAGTTIRRWYVEGHAGDFATLDAALEVLHVQRLGALPAEARA